MGCSGWSSIIWLRSTAADIKFALSLRLVSSRWLSLLNLGWLLYYGGADDRKSLAYKDFITKRVQVVQCLTVDPYLIQLQTGIKFDLVVPALVWFRKLIVCRWSFSGLFLVVLLRVVCTSLQVLILLHEQVGPIILNAFLHFGCCRGILGLSLLHRRLCCNLNHWFSKLLHLHLNYQLLEMPLGTVILLLDYKLTFGFSIALYLAL